MAGPNWSLGRYEEVAEQLLPAVEVLVERAGIREGERVVDLGCGTGSAGLAAARRGATVIGVDPAARLLDVAREQARAEGLDASFVLGEAAAMPLDDDRAEVIISSFGVIFAPDANAAASEMSRVLAPRGRLVLTAWIPEGPISRAVRVGSEAISAATGHSEPEPFPWHQREALAELLGPHGFEVETEAHRHPFIAASPEAYLEGEMRNHPLWIAGQAVLEPRGEADAVRERVLEILTEANEDTDSFRVTSRYVVARARRERGPI